RGWRRACSCFLCGRRAPGLLAFPICGRWYLSTPRRCWPSSCANLFPSANRVPASSSPGTKIAGKGGKRMRVGLPRALLYFKYYPVLEQLFRSNGWEPVVSTPTNKRKLEQGLALCEDEVCLPVKVMMGHVRSLAEQDIDALFVPRVV